MASVSESLNFQSEDIIPKERRNRPRLTALQLCLLLIILFVIPVISGVYTFDSKHIFNSVGLILMLNGITDLVKGVCNFSEEIYHLKTRYNGSYTKAIKACGHKTTFPLLFGGLFLFVECTDFEEGFSWPQYYSTCLALICNLLYITLGFETLTQVDISSICEKNHLNVAHGLAWSYYIGYLKIILPRFKESVRCFNEKNGNLLRCDDTCKVHILIPLSCTIYADLSSADPNIQYFKNLPSLSTDRAGIKGRVFKNSIYTIFDEEKRPCYCVVEYATPLSSLYEMSNISSTAFSREDRIQQAKLFYRTLEHILETDLEPDYRNLYRLIAYDDCQENDQEERNSHFLSNLILKHVQQQQEEEYSVYKSDIDN